jgi:hypothetical protein
MKWQVRKARSLHQNYFSIMQSVQREMHSEQGVEVIVEDGYARETSKLKAEGPVQSELLSAIIRENYKEITNFGRVYRTLELV